MDDVGDHSLQIRILPPCHGLLAAIHTGSGDGTHIGAAMELADAAQQGGGIAGFGHEIIHAPAGAVADDLVVDKAGKYNDAAMGPGFRHTAQQLQTVQLGQHQIHQQQIRLQFRQQTQSVHTVLGGSNHFQVCFPVKSLADEPAEILIGVGNKNAHFGFHNFILPLCIVRSDSIL